MRRPGQRMLWHLGMLGAVGLVGVAWVFGPSTLQDMDVFRVRQVEVVGTRFLDPYSVVSAAGLRAESSLFDDSDVWLAGVKGLTLVAEVSARRVFPSTVRLEVREVEPVALVDVGTLRPVDATGRLLDLEPAGVVLDLPIVSGVEVEGGVLKPGTSAEALTTVAALMSRAPAVAGRISQAELVGETLRLTFRTGRTTAVLPAAATASQVTQLRLAFADLLARGELEQVRKIDVRFRDQVVVSFLDTP